MTRMVTKTTTKNSRGDRAGGVLGKFASLRQRRPIDGRPGIMATPGAVLLALICQTEREAYR